MKELSLEEIKGMELDILTNFHDFCMKHELKYSLGAGTMIGAVRHKGFIPWDDDIDIFMERKYYDRFIELVKGGKKMRNEDLRVMYPEMENYLNPFIKIVNVSTRAYEHNRKEKYLTGIWIDIFPIDFCGDTQEEAMKMVEHMRKNVIRLTRMNMHYTEKNLKNFFKNAYLFVFRHLGKDYLTYKNNLLKYELPETGKFAGPIIWAYPKGKGMCDIYPMECFDGYINVKFEGKEFMMFSHYDEMLTMRYGDYMTLPKEKDRPTHCMKVVSL